MMMSSNTSSDFMSQARSLASQEKITMTEAMRRVTREQPQLYAAFLTAESKRPVLSK